MAVATLVPQQIQTSAGRRRSSADKRPGISEQEAIALAIQGDEQAFEQLYHDHKRQIYSICLRMTRNVADAEDLAQEAFLQAFRKLHTFRGDAAFSTWLHRLTVNIVLMRFRRRRISELSLDDPTGADGSHDEPLVLAAMDASLSRCVDRITLDRVVSQLPPGYKLIFLLHDVFGYEHREIADILSCTAGNSKSQLHKARLKLRDVLTQRKDGIRNRRDDAETIRDPDERPLERMDGNGADSPVTHAPEPMVDGR